MRIHRPIGRPFTLSCASFSLICAELTELQAKNALDTGLHTPSNIYNMDECAFNLSSDRKTLRGLGGI